MLNFSRQSNLLELEAQAREKKELESREVQKMEASMQGSLDLVKLDVESEMGICLLSLCLFQGLRKTELGAVLVCVFVFCLPFGLTTSVSQNRPSVLVNSSQITKSRTT